MVLVGVKKNDAVKDVCDADETTADDDTIPIRTWRHTRRSEASLHTIMYN
jgi:hypothetical protein